MTIERVNERELLSAATQGSQIAYRELIHLHQGAVYRFALVMAGEDDAQTITENAFLTAWRQLEYLKDLNMSFRERLLQLVCIDCANLKKRARRVNLPAAEDADALNFPFEPMRYDPRTNMEHLALQTDIEEALRALPLHFRQILLLHEMGNLADTQIADITGDDAQTVHTDLARARAFVRRQIILGGGFFPLEGDDTHQDAGKKYQACKAYLPTLAAAADDLCTNAEKQMLSTHFAACPGCQGYYESLRAIHHGITVMKREVPGDMASYIIHRIQQEEGKGDFAAPGEKLERHRFRPAFGRFTIIGLCIALVFLAYSNGIIDRGSEDGDPLPPSQSQTGGSAQTPNTAPEDGDPVAPTDPTTPDIPEDPDTPTEDPENPDTPADPDAPPTGGEDQTPGDGENGGATIVPGGGGESSTLIPTGEVYAAIRIADAAGSDTLAQYASLSFRSTLTGGQAVLYYVIPAANGEALETALTEANLPSTPYEDTSAIDSAAGKLLYIVYL